MVRVIAQATLRAASAAILAGALSAACLAEDSRTATGLAQATASPLPSSGTTPPASADRSGAYRLDYGDRLRFRFFDRFDREDLNGDYSLDEMGQVRLPRIGTFNGRKKTLAEFQDDIRRGAEAAGQKLGYFSIDIIEHRPFYVVGLANHPGAFSFVPGMTILHAVSLAGGYYRSPMTSALESMREGNKVSETEEALRGLIARRARLYAERDGAATVRVPDELVQLDPATAQSLIDRENTVLARQREVFARDKTSLQNVIDLTKAEGDSLRGEIATIKKQQETKESFLEEMKNLYNKGLANQQRYSDALTATESSARDAQMAIAAMSRSQATLDKAERDLSMLTLERDARNSRDIAQVEEDISRARVAVENSRKLVNGARALSGQDLLDEKIQFKIMRRDDAGAWTFIDSTETTPVEPGDVIKIWMPGRQDQPQN